MNWYSVFYWLTVADSVKTFFDVSSNIFSWFTVIFGICIMVCSIGLALTISESGSKNDKEDDEDSDIRAWKKARFHVSKLFYTMLTLSLITWLGYIFTPTKRDALIIVAGGAVGNFITTDSSSKAIPAELTKYVRNYLKNEAEDLDTETKEELGLATPKESLINKAKNMTKEEIITFLQTDTTVVK